MSSSRHRDMRGRRRAVPFFDCKGYHRLAADDLSEPVLRGRIRARRQSRGRKHDCADVGFDHQMLAEQFSKGDAVTDRPAEPALLLAEGQREQAEIGELLPRLLRPRCLASHQFLARVEIVALFQILADAVAQHLLFFGVVEIHRAYAPAARLRAIRSRCTSFEPA